MGSGAGIFNSSGALDISHSTIVYNVGAPNSGGIWTNTSSLHMHNTIVAGNGLGSDLFGTLKSSGYNLIGRSQGGNGYADTDILDVSPMIDDLANNGGSTLTHALLPGSPAIDAGDPNPDNPPEWDQRGPTYSRIVNGRLDIGAFEVQAAPVPAADRASPLLAAILTTADFDTDELW